MNEKIWFLVKVVNGRMEIVSKIYNTFAEVKDAWKDSTNTAIAETVWG